MKFKSQPSSSSSKMFSPEWIKEQQSKKLKLQKNFHTKAIRPVDVCYIKNISVLVAQLKNLEATRPEIFEQDRREILMVLVKVQQYLNRVNIRKFLNSLESMIKEFKGWRQFIKKFMEDCAADGVFMGKKKILKPKVEGYVRKWYELRIDELRFHWGVEKALKVEYGSFLTSYENKMIELDLCNNSSRKFIQKISRIPVAPPICYKIKKFNPKSRIWKKFVKSLSTSSRLNLWFVQYDPKNVLNFNEIISIAHKLRTIALYYITTDLKSLVKLFSVLQNPTSSFLQSWTITSTPSTPNSSTQVTKISLSPQNLKISQCDSVAKKFLSHLGNLKKFRSHKFDLVVGGQDLKVNMEILVQSRLYESAFGLAMKEPDKK